MKAHDALTASVAHEKRRLEAHRSKKLAAYKLGGKPAVDEFLAVTDFVTPYYRDVLIGLIDGTTGAFNTDCQTGLIGSVKSGYDVITYGSTAYLPSSVIKLQMSVNDVTSATNSVTAFCNFTTLFN